MSPFLLVGRNRVLVHNNNPCAMTGIGTPNKLAVAEAIENSELSIVRPHRIGASRGSAIHEHHVLPQEHEALFKKRGIDIHDYVVDVSVSDHGAIHGGGNWRLGRQEWQGEWNAQIMRELKQTTRAAGRRLTRYGISGDFHRYSKAPQR